MLLLAVNVIVCASSLLVKKEKLSPTIVLHFEHEKHSGPDIATSASSVSDFSSTFFWGPEVGLPFDAIDASVLLFVWASFCKRPVQGQNSSWNNCVVVPESKSEEAKVSIVGPLIAS